MVTSLSVELPHATPFFHFFRNTVSQPFPLAAPAALSSYVRSCMLESVRSTLWVVCASPCVESSVYSDRMWSPVLLSWVRVPCLTLRFLSFGQGSCFDTAPCFRPALCVCRFLFHDGRPHVRPCIPSSGAGALLKTLDTSDRERQAV